MASYRLIEPVMFGGVRHEPGTILDLDDKVAGPLLAAQAVEPSGDEAEALPFDDPPSTPPAAGGKGKGKKG